MRTAPLKQTIAAILPSPLLEALIALKYRGRQLPEHQRYVDAVAGRRGLEIGGPSIVFKTVLPLYQALTSLDGANFAATTLWEGSIAADRPYRYYGRRTGRQFIAEATDLAPIATGSQDFVLSSNCLEHVANPLKALTEWQRVLRPGGALVLVLPNPAGNFDHRRPVTSLAHLLDDYRRNTSEDDLTHLEEILALHDLALDPPAGNADQFRQRSLENKQHRALHHHVFDLDLMRAMLAQAGLQVLHSTATPKDFFALASKPVLSAAPA